MTDDVAAPPDRLVDRHLRFGWTLLALAATSGLVLETLIGFRVAWIVDVDTEIRRAMFRLAHAHGALLGLIHVAFALTLGAGRLAGLGAPGRTSAALLVGGIAIPLGFAGGGVWIHGSDPGLLVLLVPLGAVAWIAALVDVARGVRAAG